VNDKDYIKDLFSEKLGQHEAPVRADLWNGIQSQLGNTAAAAATKGLSIASKWMIGIASSVVIAGTAVLLVPASKPAEPKVHVQSPVENKTVPAETLVSQSTVIQPETVTTNHESNASRQVETQMVNPTEIQTAPMELLVNQLKPTPVVDPVNPPVYNRQPQKQIENAEPTHAETAVKETEPANVAPAPKEATIGTLSNAITPNEDNANDYLFVETQNLADFQVTILDDKNHVVFSSSDKDFRWNGTDKFGDRVPEGNYFYYITAVDQLGQKINKYSPLRVIYH
jgi:gliding motility-associated-like protein